MDRVPEEIISNVTSRLEKDSLKALRLVSRKLERIAAEALFYFVGTYDDDITSYECFRKIANDSRLRNLVRSIGFHVPQDNEHQDRSLTFLRKFPCLQQLSILYQNNECRPGVCSHRIHRIEQMLIELSSVTNLLRIPHFQLHFKGIHAGELPECALVESRLRPTLACLEGLGLSFCPQGYSDWDEHQQRLAPFLEYTEKLSLLRFQEGRNTVSEGPPKYNVLRKHKDAWPKLSSLNVARVCTNEKELLDFLFAHKDTLRELRFGKLSIFGSAEMTKPVSGWINVLKTIKSGLRLEILRVLGSLVDKSENLLQWEPFLEGSDGREIFNKFLQASRFPTKIHCHEGFVYDQGNSAYDTVIDNLFGRSMDILRSKNKTLNLLVGWDISGSGPHELTKPYRCHFAYVGEESFTGYIEQDNTGSGEETAA
ncbi:MAG: hypothetical protein Q9227_007189 [Pyrenula ochraceoflavens]